MKTALVIGGSGLVGAELVSRLSNEGYYDKVIVLSRRSLDLQLPKVEVRVIDFDHPAHEEIRGDHVFCAIGTTLKKAGSKQRQYQIDCEYPANIATIAKENSAEKFILVSSVGANKNSANFYLRTKGDLEQRLRELKFKSLVILRPSMIIGERKESRPGEKAGIFLAALINPLLVGPLKKYRGVKASDIAVRMIMEAVRSAYPGETIISSDQIPAGTRA